MKSKTPTSNQQISYKSNNEDSVVIILNTVPNASGRQIHEKKVRKCVDYLCRIWSRIVILEVVRT